jgi:hypothetical protein
MRSFRVSAVTALALLAALLLLVAPATRVSAFSPRWRAEQNMPELEAMYAAEGKEVPAHIRALARAPHPGIDCSATQDSSTVWMCISTVLVLGMSPALALFEAGMLRSKNTVSLITQVIAGVITLSMLWFSVGFSLTFGPTQGGFIGNFDNVFFIDVSYGDCSKHAPQIPEALFALFQMMFAVSGTHRNSSRLSSS